MPRLQRRPDEPPEAFSSSTARQRSCFAHSAKSTRLVRHHPVSVMRRLAPDTHRTSADICVGAVTHLVSRRNDGPFEECRNLVGYLLVERVDRPSIKKVVLACPLRSRSLWSRNLKGPNRLSGGPRVRRLKRRAPPQALEQRRGADGRHRPIAQSPNQPDAEVGIGNPCRLSPLTGPTSAIASQRTSGRRGSAEDCLAEGKASYCAPELSSRSIHGFTLSPRAMRAMLSSETLRSDRSTPLR